MTKSQFDFSVEHTKELFAGFTPAQRVIHQRYTMRQITLAQYISDMKKCGKDNEWAKWQIQYLHKVDCIGRDEYLELVLSLL